jgi:outer membrane protein
MKLRNMKLRNVKLRSMTLTNLLSSLVLLSVTLGAQATNLLDAYQQAWQNDPTLQAARSQLEANHEAINQARASLWPTINASASKTLYNHTINESVIANAASTTLTRNKPRTITLALSQPLFNPEVFAQIKQAHAVVKKSIVNFQAAQQGLIMRVANAYLDILEAQDTLSFTLSEKKAIARQLLHAKQRYKVGLETVTSVYDAQASFDAVIARQITARNNLQNRLESLGELTGTTYKRLDTIRGHLPLHKPQPAQVEHWVHIALHTNRELLAAHADVAIAREQVSVTRSTMLPHLHLTAHLNNSVDNNFGGLGTLNTRARDVGLSLQVPVFQGGRLWSLKTQNQHELSVALARLDAARKAVVSRTHQAYNSSYSGISAIQADRQAVQSAQSSLSSTESALKAGTRTMLDVLNKQRDLYAVKRQLASDQYRYIHNLLQLKFTAGLLTLADLKQINAWLHCRGRCSK